MARGAIYSRRPMSDLPTAEPAAGRAAARADRASARFPTSRRRTTGTGATWPSTGGSPSAARACGWSTWRAARATARRVLAERGGRGRRRRRQPRGTRARAPALHARPNLRFERALVEEFEDGAPWDAIVFLQTIEHVERAAAAAGALRVAAGARAASPTSARRTASRSRRREPSAPATRGTCASTRRPSTARCSRPASRSVELLGRLPRAQAARARAGAAARLGPRASGAAASRGPSTTGSCRRSTSATSPCATGELDRALDFLAVCRP